MEQEQYNDYVKSEISNFILWFWSDDKDRKRPLEALEEYHQSNNYNEV